MFDRDPSMKKWLPANVVELREGEVKVHYEGFAAKFDEWLPVDTIHISTFGAHTKTKCLYQLRVCVWVFARVATCPLLAADLHGAL